MFNIVQNLQYRRVFFFSKIFVLGLLLVCPSYLFADNHKYEPHWHQELTKYLTDNVPESVSNSIMAKYYNDNIDQRISEITKIVNKDRSRGVADLILYYETMGKALHLFTKGN